MNDYEQASRTKVHTDRIAIVVVTFHALAVIAVVVADIGAVNDRTIVVVCMIEGRRYEQGMNERKQGTENQLMRNEACVVIVVEFVAALVVLAAVAAAAALVVLFDGWIIAIAI